MSTRDDEEVNDEEMSDAIDRQRSTMCATKGRNRCW